jgi:polyketide biosynthesis acyl carrier protein
VDLGGGVLSEETIMTTIRHTVCAVVPEVDPDSVVPGKRLADIGCNSIDRADIVTRVMAELAVTVPVWEFGSGHNIGALIGIFQRYS